MYVCICDIVQCIRRDLISRENRDFVCMYVCMYVCVCVFSNVFSETTGPIEAKFHVESPWDRGRKFIQIVQVICCSSLLSTSVGGGGGRGGGF